MLLTNPFKTRRRQRHKERFRVQDYAFWKERLGERQRIITVGSLQFWRQLCLLDPRNLLINHNVA